MSKYADIEQIKKIIRSEWVKYMPSDLDINLSFVLGKIAEVPTIEVSEDCISRAYAIEVLSHVKKDEQWRTECIDNEIRLIKLLPSVVPSRAEGEWIIDEPPSTGHGAIYTCPFCGHEEFEPTNLCPACGEKMKG